ncbi:MAG: hypothetical protein GY865_10475 [candidate division Zixibacteria bacterium]|nr:hypothetical protein [candidate division Zixibacteria bacterium]
MTHVCAELDGTPIQPNRDYVINWYDFSYYPTCFFDGGQATFVGGDDRVFLYEDSVESVRGIPVQDVDLDVSMEWLGGGQIRINVNIVNNEYENYAPDAPSMPTGDAMGMADGTYEFSSTGTDPNRQQVYYMWDWGDGDVSDWLGPFDYEVASVLSHTWTEPGQYNISTKIKDDSDLESPWSDAGFIDIWECGDVDDNNDINILDIVAVINYKYKGGAAPIPIESGDVDNNGDVNILDIVVLINFKYKGGSAPVCPTI